MPGVWRELNGGLEGAMRTLARAQRAGLIAQANVIRNAWKRELRSHHGGFTTGRFSTGHAINALTVGEVFQTGFASFAIRVGTNVRYHLFWEVGHLNSWTRRYERVPTLEPAVNTTQDEQRAAFGRAFRRVWNGGAEQGTVSAGGEG